MVKIPHKTVIIRKSPRLEIPLTDVTVCQLSWMGLITGNIRAHRNRLGS